MLPDASKTIAAVIVAAGRGERAGQSDGPKQYRRIGDRAVLAHTVERFLDHPGIGPVVVVIHPDDHALCRETLGEAFEHVAIVDGGPTRQASTLNGLRALRGSAPDIVLVHDAVRPFAGVELIGRVVAAVGPDHGAIAAMAVADTLKRGADGLVQTTVSRDGLFAAQTPQGFPYPLILEAHERAAGEADFTDDASIAEWAGLPVRLVAGSADNTKLTWGEDIRMADEKLRGGSQGFPDVRTGNGYDVHRFEEGSSVTLCGVEIVHVKRLSGHSDADVGLHALTDALLATCGAGDIGTHFPPSDPQWKGAASSRFVEHAVALVRAKGGRIANADVTLICEAPKVGPHRDAMVAAMAGMLCIAPDRISVKATTNEKLGFLGRGEGIAAIATASVVYPGSLPE